jgi:AcrR family transcriptional regulator
MSLRESNKIKTRMRILRVARNMFRERGYEDTLVGDIADKAEVSRQTLYNYFPSKESLLIGIADAEMQSLELLLNTETGKHATSIDKIKSLLEEYIIDSVTYLSLARRIAFHVVENEATASENGMSLVSGATSAWGGATADESPNRINKLLAPLVDSAKDEGAIRNNIPTEAAVDALLGIYYVILFETSITASLTKEDFKRRISRLEDIILTGLS